MELSHATEGNAALDMSHILLVEDEASVANGLRLVLREEGYDVEMAMSGHEALEKFRQHPFELVVTDLRLPDISGMDVIKEIKLESPQTEVVVITGYPSVATAVESAKMGVRDYLRKPFTDDELISVVDTALKQKQQATFEEFLDKTAEGRIIQKREVLRALNRTSEDLEFWRDLMEKGSPALDAFRLSSSAKAALASGDLKWINENVGELTQKQLKFIFKRGEREAW